MTINFIANAGGQIISKAKSAANLPVGAELQLLQGAWTGVTVGDQSQQKIRITIIGNSLHFHRDSNFWFETTITLPTDTDPKRLCATIKGCPPSQADSIGKVVVAIYQIQDEKLTLAALGGGEEEAPTSFEIAEERGLARYELRKVQPQMEDAEPPKTK